jgi:hypothetical protein
VQGRALMMRKWGWLVAEAQELLAMEGQHGVGLALVVAEFDFVDFGGEGFDDGADLPGEEVMLGHVGFEGNDVEEVELDDVGLSPDVAAAELGETSLDLGQLWEFDAELGSDVDSFAGEVGHSNDRCCNCSADHGEGNETFFQFCEITLVFGLFDFSFYVFDIDDYVVFDL